MASRIVSAAFSMIKVFFLQCISVGGKLLLIYVFLFAYGCAENPKKMEPSHIPYKTYEDYSCEELEQELAVVKFKSKRLYYDLKKKYENDKVWASWGSLVFPFNLLVLEGKNDPQVYEYRRLLGMEDTIKRTAREKDCGWQES